jgi:hypothetical protein
MDGVGPALSGRDVHQEQEDLTPSRGGGRREGFGEVDLPYRPHSGMCETWRRSGSTVVRQTDHCCVLIMGNQIR